MGASTPCLRAPSDEAAPRAGGRKGTLGGGEADLTPSSCWPPTPGRLATGGEAGLAASEAGGGGEFGLAVSEAGGNGELGLTGAAALAGQPAN